MVKSGYILGGYVFVHQNCYYIGRNTAGIIFWFVNLFSFPSLFSQLFSAGVSAMNGFLLVWHSLNARWNVDLCYRLPPQRVPSH